MSAATDLPVTLVCSHVAGKADFMKRTAARAALLTILVVVSTALGVGGAEATDLSWRPAVATPDPARGKDPGLDRPAALREVRGLLAAEGRDGAAQRRELRERRDRFTDEENVFFPSTLAVSNLEDPEKADAVLPLFRGVDPTGNDDEQYIITEASDFDVARRLGVNYAPKLVWARGSGGDQKVSITGDGRIQFAGQVDFAPELVLEPATQETVVPGTSVFPPARAEPGAVADAEWSSAVVLPSGLVVNAQIVANDTGQHDRITALDVAHQRATFELLDGRQGGDALFYHLVTDSSDPVASGLEKAVYAPRLNNLPRFGSSNLDDRSALLGFSPNINGREGRDDPEHQGLNYIVASGGQDPINIFPLDPDNQRRRNNNYSPFWDAHVNQWTRGAVDSGKRRAITGFEDLRNLVAQGLVESGAISPPGTGNEFVAGLRPTNIVINCPVIAQPFEKNENEGDDDPTT